MAKPPPPDNTVPTDREVLEAKELVDLLTGRLYEHVHDVIDLGLNASYSELMAGLHSAQLYDRVVDPGEGDPLVYSLYHPRINRTNSSLDNQFYTEEMLATMETTSSMSLPCLQDVCHNMVIDGFIYLCRECVIAGLRQSNPPLEE